MSRTARTHYKGKTIRDGEWGRKCPSPNCKICGTGHYKRTRTRGERYEGKKESKNYER